MGRRIGCRKLENSKERLTWNKSSSDFIFQAVVRLQYVKQGSDLVRLLFPLPLNNFPSMPCFKEKYMHFCLSLLDGNFRFPVFVCSISCNNIPKIE